LDDEEISLITVSRRVRVHANAEVPRPALPQIRAGAALIEDCNVARERIALGA